ncbi:MAG: DUF7088 domain-containing protein [Oscillospiraceae bacterium]|jgi:ABC-2 type transport system permease protein
MSEEKKKTIASKDDILATEEEAAQDREEKKNKEKEAPKKKVRLFSSRSSRKGSYSIGISVAVIAIAIAACLLLNLLPDSAAKFDISDKRIYEISDTTKDLVAALDKTIEITVICDPDSLDERIRRIVDEYDELSDNITVTYADPVKTPSVLDLADENEIYVYCPETEKSKTISFDDIIQYDAYTYYTTGTKTETAFDGEGQLTSAIDVVTSEKDNIVYALKGHGESDLPSSISSRVDKLNITIQDVTLLLGDTLDYDVSSVLLINGPVMDLTTEELEAIRTYMAAGGSVIYLAKYQGTTFSLDNFNALLGDYDLEQQPGFVQDPDRAFNNAPTSMLPTIGYLSGITSDSYSQGLLVLLYDSTGTDYVVGFKQNITASCDVSALLSTTENAYITYTDDSGQDVTETGKYIVGAMSEKTDDDQAGTMFVFTDVLIDDYVITNYSGSVSNADIFLNCLTYKLESVSNISIDSKSLEVTYNTIDNGMTYGALYMLVIPLTVLIAGLVVWLRRRRA